MNDARHVDAGGHARKQTGDPRHADGCRGAAS